MKIAQILAKYSLAEADELRKAIGKKKAEVMAQHRARFIEGTKQTGINQALAEKLFDLIENFGGYGFNKSHSAAYALIAYHTAYLKAHYPVQFMAALLTQDMGQLSDEIDDVAEMMAQVSTSSTAYDKQLITGAERLEQSRHQNDVRSIVLELRLATRAMEIRNRALEEQLEKSRARAAELQRDVESVRLENATDALTKIANRRHFVEVLVKLVAEARHQKHPLTLLMIDIDHFKRVNDTYGRPMGDQVLRIVAASIMASIRDGDVPARYGGDEFGVLLPNTDMAAGRLIAEQLGQAIAGRELIKRSTGENLGRVMVSIGVAQLRDNEPLEQFAEHADKCLYAAKRAGRDRVVCEPDA